MAQLPWLLSGHGVGFNASVDRIACTLRLQVPSALRAPAAGYLERSGLMDAVGCHATILLKM